MKVVDLTAKQRKFCEEYVKCYNTTQAYLVAYPNATYDTAKANAYRLLRDERIKNYLTLLEKQVFEDNRINYEHIGNELARMAFDGETPKNVKLRAIDLLQKQLGLQTQKISADVSTEINVKIE